MPIDGVAAPLSIVFCVGRCIGRVRVATLVRSERRSSLSLGLDSRRDKAHLGALMSFSSGGRPVRCSTHVKEDEATSAL